MANNKTLIVLMLLWANAGPCFGIDDLPDGGWDIVNDEYGEVVRVNLNKIKDWSKVPGIKMRWEVTGPNGETSAAQGVRSAIKDVDGDGKLDLFRTSHRTLMRFDENNNMIWKSRQLNSDTDDESRMPVIDLDGDGQYECILSLSDKTYCINAENGNVKWEVSTGAQKHYSSMVVGHFNSKSKYSIAVRVQKQILCFDCDGNTVWTCSFNAANTNGHCMQHWDINNDGYDEILLSLDNKIFAVSHSGDILWEDDSQEYHSDWILIGDMDNDGEKEAVYDHDGCAAASGPIYVADGMTGKREQSWPYNWPSSFDSHGAVIGDFRPDIPGLETARTDKFKFIELRDCKGNVLWEKNHASVNISKGDWDGDGIIDLLVTAAGLAGGPHFSVWNGLARVYGLRTSS